MANNNSIHLFTIMEQYNAQNNVYTALVLLTLSKSLENMLLSLPATGCDGPC